MATLNSSIFKDVPQGDKLRIDLVDVSHSTLTTLTNVASGGGMFHGIAVAGNVTSAEFDEIRVTVDGASERTFNISPAFRAIGSSTSSGYFLPLPINFNDSCTVKIDVSHGGAGALEYLGIYSVG